MIVNSYGLELWIGSFIITKSLYQLWLIPGHSPITFSTKPAISTAPRCRREGPKCAIGHMDFFEVVAIEGAHLGR